MPDSNSTVGGYTPGPWHVEHRIHVKAENGYRVATVNVPSGRVGSIEVNPSDNARLIAAAPDLLAACEYQEHIQSTAFKGDPAEAIAKVREMRRAAIAKATGATS